MKRVVAVRHNNFYTDEFDTRLYRMGLNIPSFSFGSTMVRSLLAQMSPNTPKSFAQMPFLVLVEDEDNAVLAWTETNPEEKEINLFLRESHYDLRAPMLSIAAANDERGNFVPPVDLPEVPVRQTGDVRSEGFVGE
jgi:hypothetical protein